MKKLMKKKVNVFGKSIPVFAILMIGMIGLASATLVPYLSNTVTGTVDVESPIAIEITGITDGTNTATTFDADIYGGESFTVNTTTNILVDGVTGHIAQNKIANFDGEGLTITYTDSNYPGHVWELPLCEVGGDAYYYIGDPSETLNIGTSDGETTFKAAINLDPDTNLEVETEVIMANMAACENIPAPRDL